MPTFAVEARLARLVKDGASISSAIRSVRAEGYKISNDRARVVARLVSKRNLTDRQKIVAGRIVTRSPEIVSRLRIAVKVTWQARIGYELRWESGSDTGSGEVFIEGSTVVIAGRSPQAAATGQATIRAQQAVDSAVTAQTGLPQYAVAGHITRTNVIVTSVEAAIGA